MFFDIVNRTENQGGFEYAINERIFGAMYKNGTMFKGNFANGNRMDGVHYAADGKVIKVYQK